MAIRIQIRRDIAANWTTANPILADGEAGYEKDTGKIKFGNGVDDWNTLPYRFEFAVPDHGALPGLGDDDHPQYLNELRHDTLPNDNPHGVTAAQTGAYDQAQTDIEIANAIAAHEAALDPHPQYNETVTSISLASNILTYTDENGTPTNIDLSLYLDDTNLARIVSGSIDPLTGIVTFTRDDSSTFTIDFSSLLDNQNASEVPVTPSGNLTSTDVQAALVEHQGDIDSINTTTTSLQSQISSNDTDISNLQSEQTTQNNNISTNASNIGALQSSQATQDTAIALNTTKVSADGTISTHSDVDTITTLPASGDTLTWDGVNWIPRSINNEYSIFPIWAEESGGLTNSNRQWSFGNGATGAINIVIPFDCEVFAMTMDALTFGTSVSIDLMVDDGVAGTANFTGKFGTHSFTPISITSGQRVGFQSNSEVGAYANVRVCIWCRIKSTALFPTPDRSVVNNSNLSFTSTTWAIIPGMSTTVSISDTGTIDGTLTYSALRAGGVNSISEFRIVIGGNNGQVFFDTLSTFNDTGAVSHFVENLPPGTYTVSAECQVDQPITITSCQLAVVGVES